METESWPRQVTRHLHVKSLTGKPSELLTLFLLCFVDKLQYYDDTFSSVKEQKAFERNLFNKTHRANAEVIMLDGMTCIYRNSVDLFFYVMGSSNENGVCATLSLDSVI